MTQKKYQKTSGEQGEKDAPKNASKTVAPEMGGERFKKRKSAKVKRPRARGSEASLRPASARAEPAPSGDFKDSSCAERAPEPPVLSAESVPSGRNKESRVATHPSWQSCWWCGIEATVFASGHWCCSRHRDLRVGKTGVAYPGRKITRDLHKQEAEEEFSGRSP